MSKSPEDRYSSAQELADDLRRFLEDKPIHARRPVLRERFTKWAWRHKSLVAAGGLVLMVAVLGLMISTFFVWREKERTIAALAEAENQGRRAEVNFKKALAAVEQMLTRISEEDYGLAHEPGAEVVRRKLLEDALRFYQGFLQEQGPEPAVRREMGA